MDRIKRELQACSILVSLLSKRSIGRPWINFEAGAAWVADKLLPVYFGNMTTASLPRPFADLTAVDLRKDSHGLVRVVSQKLSKTRKQTLPSKTFPYELATAGELMEDRYIQSLKRTLDEFEDIP